MARTRYHPREHRQPIPTLAQLQEDNIVIQYFMILNRLERDYGIDRIAEIYKSWGEISNAEKLEKVKILASELDAEIDKEAERRDWANDPKYFKTRGC